MKPTVLNSGVVIIAVACLVSGCGKSSSDTNDTAQKAATETPAPVTAAPANSASNPPAATAVDMTTAAAPSAAANPAPAAPDTSTASAADAVSASASQLTAAAASQPDKQAASLASELGDKAKALAASASSNPTLKAQVGSALQSLTAGKDASALGTLFQQAKQANLTPQQTQLVKDVSNVASAYVVQKNFSSVDGAQGDVATIVNSLRKGSIAPAVSALQSLAQNAALTPQQKDLIGTLADQYAPGLKKTTDSLKQGLQSLQGLTK